MIELQDRLAAGPTIRLHDGDNIVIAGTEVATRNYVGIISTVNCSATVVHRIAEWFTPERLAEFPQHRRRGRLRPWPGLRHGNDRRAHGPAAPHAGRLCEPCQPGRRAGDRPGLRTQPDRRPAAGAGPARGSAPGDLRHAGHRRHPQDGRSRRGRGARTAAGGQPGHPHPGAGEPSLHRPAMRRLRRLFRPHRQPGAKSKSELLGLGDHEFVPWQIGITG